MKPSISVDLPKILDEIAQVTGTPPASLNELFFVSGNTFFGSVQDLLDRLAMPEEVDRAAKSIEQVLKNEVTSREEFRKVLRQVMEKGLLDKHGTPRAREHLRRWDRELSPNGSQQKS